MIRTGKIAAWIVSTVAAFASGCTSYREVYAVDVDMHTWQNPASITLTNADTASLRDFSIFLRYNDSFTADTLTLRITLFTPDSLRHQERLFVTCPRSTRPASMPQETLIPYRTRIRLLHQGKYRVQLTPTSPVSGIEAVGIHLEKSI